jgi:hypothetical protein
MKKIIYVLIAICCIGLFILPILDKGNTNTINIDDINTHILNGDTISNDTIVIWKDEYKPYK